MIRVKLHSLHAGDIVAMYGVHSQGQGGGLEKKIRSRGDIWECTWCCVLIHRGCGHGEQPRSRMDALVHRVPWKQKTRYRCKHVQTAGLLVESWMGNGGTEVADDDPTRTEPDLRFVYQRSC